MVVEEGLENKVEEILAELQKGAATDLSKWKFVFGTKTEIETLFRGFKTDISLNEKASTSTVFIIDRARKLRGRDDDEEVGTLYGYNTASVAELNKKMTDDVKVILAEYRLALKKNNSNRAKWFSLLFSAKKSLILIYEIEKIHWVSSHTFTLWLSLYSKDHWPGSKRCYRGK